MSEHVEHLDVEDLVALAVDLLGDPPPIRDAGLLASAAARPQASVFGEDAYPDIWTKAAALLHSIVKNHPLIDGNKRLGWLATAVFLELNGVDVTDITNDDVFEFVIAVTIGTDDIEQIAGPPNARSLMTPNSGQPQTERPVAADSGHRGGRPRHQSQLPTLSSSIVPPPHGHGRPGRIETTSLPQVGH